MEISVIIPSYNGANKFPTLLEALCHQSVQGFQVVLVIDGSVDNSQEKASEFAARMNLKVITQENRGRSGAKNRGVIESSGDLLVFFDDDVEPSKDSIERHLNIHLKAENPILLGGSVHEPAENARTDIQFYKSHISSAWTEKYPDLISMDFENVFFTAANCSLTRETFTLIGGFDPAQNDAEDYDLAIRALEQGVPVLFDKRNIVVHHELITCRRYIMRQRQYREAHFQLKRKHPLRKGNRNVAEYSVGLVKKSVYFLLSNAFWVNLVDSNLLKFVLPKRMRYILYSAIIHSLSFVFPNRKL